MDATLTALFARSQSGDRKAENLFAEMAMGRLRAIARSILGGERLGHTLRATALVNELFLQKLRSIKTPVLNSDHFYSLAANAMRQVLIDHARLKSAEKRRMPADAVAYSLMAGGASANTAPMTTLDLASQLAVRQALQRLRRLDAGAAEAIQLRYVEGLTATETALRLKRTLRQVRDDCDFGLKWMADQLAS